MDAGEGPFVGGGSAPPAPPSSRLPPGTWVGLAVLGALGFVLGIWTPAWKGVPSGFALSLLTAGVGGVLFVVGATYAWQAYARTRPVPVTELPGVELFSPPTAHRSGDEAPDDESR